MDFHLDTLLNLPNAVVDSYSNTLDAIILKLQLINDGINCPNCNEYICKTHQTRPIGSPASTRSHILHQYMDLSVAVRVSTRDIPTK